MQPRDEVCEWYEKPLTAGMLVFGVVIGSELDQVLTAGTLTAAGTPAHAATLADLFERWVVYFIALTILLRLYVGFHAHLFAEYVWKKCPDDAWKTRIARFITDAAFGLSYGLLIRFAARAAYSQDGAVNIDWRLLRDYVHPHQPSAFFLVIAALWAVALLWGWIATWFTSESRMLKCLSSCVPGQDGSVGWKPEKLPEQTKPKGPTGWPEQWRIIDASSLLAALLIAGALISWPSLTTRWMALALVLHLAFALWDVTIVLSLLRAAYNGGATKQLTASAPVSQAAE